MPCPSRPRCKLGSVAPQSWQELAECQEDVEKWKAEAQKHSDVASRRTEDRDALLTLSCTLMLAFTIETPQELSQLKVVVVQMQREPLGWAAVIRFALLCYAFKHA